MSETNSEETTSTESEEIIPKEEVEVKKREEDRDYILQMKKED